MPSSSRSPTLADVAKRARVSVATASMSLRGDARITAETRARVVTAAKAINYRADPMLSALAMRRGRARAVANIGVIVDERWELQTGGPPAWQQGFLTGLRRCGESFGYGVSVVRRGRDLAAWRDPDRVLRGRGVQGLVVVSCMPDAPPLRLQVGDYAWVMFGLPPEAGRFHRIGTDAFAAVRIACQQMLRRGVQRVGLAQHFDSERRLRFERTAAIGLSHWLAGEGPACVPPLLPEELNAESVLAWWRKEKPEVIFTNEGRVLDWLAEADVTVPGMVEVVMLDLESAGRPKVAGISQHFEACGEAALEFMHSLLLRGEKGVPQVNREVLVYPQWVEGGTLRPPPEDPIRPKV